MGKLQDFLKANMVELNEQIEVKVNGFPFPFIIRGMNQAENKAIEKSCERVSFNKKTHQREAETDKNLYMTRLVIASCVDPNFKDAELQAMYGVRGAEDLVEAMLKPGQYADLLLAVQEINGFAEDINDNVEEAKN